MLATLAIGPVTLPETTVIGVCYAKTGLRLLVPSSYALIIMTCMARKWSQAPPVLMLSGTHV